MTTYHCNNCHGTYDDISSDGVAYFHSCPDPPESAGSALSHSRRNENIIQQGTQQAVMKAAGLGRTKT